MSRVFSVLLNLTFVLETRMAIWELDNFTWSYDISIVISCEDLKTAGWSPEGLWANNGATSVFLFELCLYPSTIQCFSLNSACSSFFPFFHFSQEQQQFLATLLVHFEKRLSYNSFLAKSIELHFGIFLKGNSFIHFQCFKVEPSKENRVFATQRAHLEDYLHQRKVTVNNLGP